MILNLFLVPILLLNQSSIAIATVVWRSLVPKDAPGIRHVLTYIAMRPRMRRLLLLPILAVGLTAHAQMAEQQLAGRVVRADDGGPIAGATVKLIPSFIFGALSFQTAVTDSNGNYRFQNLKDGTYTIEASADGFVSQNYHRDASPEGVFQTIRASTRLSGIDFQLQREAIIRGVVITAAGQPVTAGIPVAAVRKEKRPNGTDRLFPASQEKTDENGEFVLKKLPPGNYFVCVNGPHGYNATASRDGTWYRETWYGNALSEDGAVQIPIREGEERRDIRITVDREERYRVVVWPSGPEGEPQPERYDMSLQGRSLSYSGRPDGSYVIRDVPPGHYKLVSTAWFGSQYVGAGHTSFDVSNQDVTVHVRVGGLGEIAGVIKWMGTASGSLTNLIIGIDSEEGAAQGSKVSAEGSFTFGRVLPGDYKFRLLKSPTDAVLRTVRCHGVPVTQDSPLPMTARQKIADCELTVESTQQ